MQTQDSIWDRTVARLEPSTPISRTKMKMGSRAMLATAPTRTVPMASKE